MKALGPIPPGFVADGNGRLVIAGRDVETLVQEGGGTPLFVYDGARVASQVARFRSRRSLGLLHSSGSPRATGSCSSHIIAI